MRPCCSGYQTSCKCIFVQEPREQKTPYIVERPDDQDEVPAKRSRDDELTTEDQGKYSEVRTYF